MIGEAKVTADGRLFVGDVELHGGCWYEVMTPVGWCDVLIEFGSAPDVQKDNWHVSFPYVCRGLSVDGLLVRGLVQ